MKAPLRPFFANVEAERGETYAQDRCVARNHFRSCARCCGVGFGCMVRLAGASVPAAASVCERRRAGISTLRLVVGQCLVPRSVASLWPELAAKLELVLLASLLNEGARQVTLPVVGRPDGRRQSGAGPIFDVFEATP
jgi:hypothetical protein